MAHADEKFLFTSESVTEGHPDKIADQISDAVLDAVMKDDPTGRAAERRLPDGEAFTIVKVPYAPDELEARLADLGWNASVTLLTPSIYVLQARR